MEVIQNDRNAVFGYLCLDREEGGVGESSGFLLLRPNNFQTFNK